MPCHETKQGSTLSRPRVGASDTFRRPSGTFKQLTKIMFLQKMALGSKLHRSGVTFFRALLGNNHVALTRPPAFPPWEEVGERRIRSLSIFIHRFPCSAPGPSATARAGEGRTLSFSMYTATPGALWFHNQCEISLWSHQARQHYAPCRNAMHRLRASSPEKLVDFHAAPAAGRW